MGLFQSYISHIDTKFCPYITHILSKSRPYFSHWLVLQTIRGPESKIGFVAKYPLLTVDNPSLMILSLFVWLSANTPDNQRIMKGYSKMANNPASVFDLWSVVVSVSKFIYSLTISWWLDDRCYKVPLDPGSKVKNACRQTIDKTDQIILFSLSVYFPLIILWILNTYILIIVW